MGGNSSVRETREGNTARTGLWCHHVCPVSEDRTGHIRGHSVCLLSQAGPATLALPPETPRNSRCSSQQEFAATSHSPSFLPSALPSQHSQSEARLHRRKPLEYRNHHALVTDFQARR